MSREQNHKMYDALISDMYCLRAKAFDRENNNEHLYIEPTLTELGYTNNASEYLFRIAYNRIFPELKEHTSMSKVIKIIKETEAESVTRQQSMRSEITTNELILQNYDTDEVMTFIKVALQDSATYLYKLALTIKPFQMKAGAIAYSHICIRLSEKIVKEPKLAQFLFIFGSEDLYQIADHYIKSCPDMPFSAKEIEKMTSYRNLFLESIELGTAQGIYNSIATELGFIEKSKPIIKPTPKKVGQIKQEIATGQAIEFVSISEDEKTKRKIDLKEEIVDAEIIDGNITATLGTYVPTEELRPALGAGRDAGATEQPVAYPHNHYQNMPDAPRSEIDRYAWLAAAMPTAPVEEPEVPKESWGQWVTRQANEKIYGKQPAQPTMV